ncbi:uncharacterized protein PFL1_01139 [Pseudozyma flocculosa PF-1]|nr:uncharacterized protein PFL1_01139 [Pseudozyma flocculosa PF-1]EPQ30950.1 hypothetical protein PFL1_01139 [Pseudozyma flocculosa PF-1]
MMPSFLYPSTPQAFIKPSLPSPPARNASGSSTAGASAATSQTTLAQRFRRAIKHDDLALAQRIASRAFELQQQQQQQQQQHQHQHQHQPWQTDQLQPRPSPGFEALQPSVGLVRPLPSKPIPRTATSRRPLSGGHPFDVRNVQHAELAGKRTKLPNYTYRLGASHESSLDDGRDSSLVLAIKNNADIELIRWLIEMGHEQKGPSNDIYGHNVLHLAALYDRADVIYAYSTYSSIYVAVPMSELVDRCSFHDRRTPLHLACIKGHEDVARQLLDLGATIDAPDREGNTALHCASAWGHLSLVQLLIERGCSFATQNQDGFTAADFAFTHSVKAALEAFGRAQFEARKRTRRGQAAANASSSAAASGSASAPGAGPSGSAFRRSLDDDTYFGRHGGKPRTEFKPPPLPLGIDQAVKGVVYSPKPIAPHSATLSAFEGHGYGLDQEEALSGKLYDDWDPERTFAQPGQDLHASNRNGTTSPHRPLMLGAGNDASSYVRPSLDLYSEYLAHSAAGAQREASDRASEASNARGPMSAGPTSTGRVMHSFSPRPSLQEDRQRAPSDLWRGGRRSPLPPSQSDGAFRPQQQQQQQQQQWHVASQSQGARRGSPSPSNGDSPRAATRHRFASLADHVRGNNASATSLFRRGPSPNLERRGTPPIPTQGPTTAGKQRAAKGSASGEAGATSPPSQSVNLSSSLPSSSVLAAGPSKSLPKKPPSSGAGGSGSGGTKDKDKDKVVQQLLEFADVPTRVWSRSPLLAEAGPSGGASTRSGATVSSPKQHHGGKGKAAAATNDNEAALRHQLKILL